MIDEVWVKRLNLFKDGIDTSIRSCHVKGGVKYLPLVRSEFPKLGPGDHKRCTIGFLPWTTQLIQIMKQSSSFDYLNQLCSACVKT